MKNANILNTKILIYFVLNYLISAISCHLRKNTYFERILKDSSIFELNDDQIEFRGMTFVGDKYCPEVNYTSDLAALSMKKLADTGANWVAIVVTEYQDKSNSSEIYPLYKDFKHSDYFTFKTETLEGLRKMILTAKSLNLKVMLKPHIDLAGEPDARIWRGDIGKNMTSEDVAKWFASYTTYIEKYAMLAEELKVEMFSVSCELIVMSQYDSYWGEIVKKIRAVYSGKLTDSANHDGEEYRKTWWDVLDYIGVDAYYLSIFTEVYKNNLTNVEHIFDDTVNKLRNLSTFFNKEVIITEIGFCSGNCKRNEVATAYDHFLQAEFYHWFYKIFAKEKYVKGFFWWAWNSDPYYGGKGDSCISPQYKVTEQILRDIYRANSTTIYEPEQKARCICTI